jgi:hypothetical protein
MRTVIAIFFFVCGVGFLALPWRSESGLIRWPLKIGLAVVCALAGLAALFVPYSD